MKSFARCVVMVAVVSVFAAAAAGEETKSPGFWAALRTKVEALVPTKQPSETTAVGGVRGEKNGDAAGLYWKGDEQTPVAVGEAESAAFLQAVALAEAKRPEALAAFEQFLVTYPESALRKDALQAIEEIKAGR